MNERLANRISQLLDSIQFRIDTTRFFFDKPRFDYQPLPWVGINDALLRGESTYARWNAMLPLVRDEYSTLKDIGCCVGFFCHSAAERNLQTIGIDYNEQFIRIANHTKSFVKNGKNETFFNLHMSPDNIATVPVTDVTVLLAVWHHWVFHYNLDRATAMLREIWNSTRGVMFFETGEEEVKEEFNLPFDRTAADWVHEYLEASLNSANVLRIGTFEAASYPHYKIKGHRRTVYAIIRK